MNKKLLLLMLALVCILCFLTSCGRLMEDTIGDALMVEAITAIENRDINMLISLLLPEVKESEGFGDQVEQIFNYFTGQMIYWEKISQNTNNFRSGEGTTTTVSSVYRITTNDDIYIVSQIRREFPSGESGILGFHLTRDEGLMIDIPIGHLRDWRDFNLFHWITLLLNILAYTVIAVTLIHCIKNRLRYKLLLILLIFTQVGMGITNFPWMSGFNTNISILNRSILLTTGDGFRVLILIPLGAILYWFIYKKFKKEIIKESVSELDIEY